MRAVRVRVDLWLEQRIVHLLRLLMGALMLILVGGCIGFGLVVYLHSSPADLPVIVFAVIGVVSFGWLAVQVLRFWLSTEREGWQ